MFNDWKMKFTPASEANSNWSRHIIKSCDKTSEINAVEMMRLLGDPGKGVTVQAEIAASHANGRNVPK